MSTALVTMDELGKMAKAMAGSGLFGVKTEQQAVAIMLVAQAQGIPPAQACVDFDIIQGKPAMTARAMLARFQQAGGVIEWGEYTEKVCEAQFSHPQCPKAIKIRWTIEDAARAGLTNKDNWRHYPRQMLSSRVMSEGVDRCYPAASGGFYPPEVVRDFAEKDITPTAGAADRLSAEQIERVNGYVQKTLEWLNTGSVADAFAYKEGCGMDAEEHIYFWTHFDSKQRRAMKSEGDRVREKHKALTTDLISDAQKKRLEARIKELGIDRDDVKKECLDQFGKEHFSELTKDEYDIIDKQLSLPQPTVAGADHETVAAAQVGLDDRAPSNTQGNMQAHPATSGENPLPTAAAQHERIREALKMAGIMVTSKFNAMLAKNDWKSVEDVPESEVDSALKFISREVDKRADKVSA